MEFRKGIQRCMRVAYRGRSLRGTNDINNSNGIGRNKPTHSLDSFSADLVIICLPRKTRQDPCVSIPFLQMMSPPSQDTNPHICPFLFLRSPPSLVRTTSLFLSLPRRHHGFQLSFSLVSDELVGLSYSGPDAPLGGLGSLLLGGRVLCRKRRELSCRTEVRVEIRWTHCGHWVLSMSVNGCYGNRDRVVRGTSKEREVDKRCGSPVWDDEWDRDRWTRCSLILEWAPPKIDLWAWGLHWRIRKKKIKLCFKTWDKWLIFHSYFTIEHLLASPNCEKAGRVVTSHFVFFFLVGSWSWHDNNRNIHYCHRWDFSQASNTIWRKSISSKYLDRD